MDVHQIPETDINAYSNRRDLSEPVSLLFFSLVLFIPAFTFKSIPMRFLTLFLALFALISYTFASPVGRNSIADRLQSLLSTNKPKTPFEKGQVFQVQFKDLFFSGTPPEPVINPKHDLLKPIREAHAFVVVTETTDEEEASVLDVVMRNKSKPKPEDVTLNRYQIPHKLRRAVTNKLLFTITPGEVERLKDLERGYKET